MEVVEEEDEEEEEEEEQEEEHVEVEDEAVTPDVINRKLSKEDEDKDSGEECCFLMIKPRGTLKMSFSYWKHIVEKFLPPPPFHFSSKMK